MCENACLNDGVCVGANKCQCPVGFDGSTCDSVNVWGNPSARLVLAYTFTTIVSWVLGEHAPRAGLPKITAYIGTGILAGEYCLRIIPDSEIRNLDVIDKISLAYIAFAAGSKPIVGGRSIATVAFCSVMFTFSLVTLVMVLMSDSLEFTSKLTTGQQGGVAILVGTLACARSPSSAIAIIDDMRASGPFTVLAMAVTCVLDVVVIFMFAVNNLIASSNFSTGGDQSAIFGKSVARLVLSTLMGVVLGKFVVPYLLWWWPPRITQCKLTRYIRYAQVSILATIGLCVFILDHYDEDFIDALIIAMAAGYVLTNHTPYAAEFHEILESTGPVVYIAFFTLVGASLGLSSFGKTFGASLLFFAVRIVSLMLGTGLGGWLADEPAAHNRVAWYAYVTQAGVALGLAKKIHGQFPDWGDEFATLIVAMVVINQLVGPPLFKHVLALLGEAHRKPPTIRGRVMVVSNVESEARARNYARALAEVGWSTQAVTLRLDGDVKTAGPGDEDVVAIEDAVSHPAVERVLADMDDQVVGVALVIGRAAAARVAEQVAAKYPDVRLIFAGSVRRGKGRQRDFPPQTIQLDTADEQAADRQLFLAAALSDRTLFPSISNAVEATHEWQDALTGGTQGRAGDDSTTTRTFVDSKGSTAVELRRVQSRSESSVDA